MIVVDNDFKHTHLRDLKGGELFEFNSTLFMRVVVPLSLTPDDLGMKEKPNCIDIENGRLAWIGWNASVIPVEAELIVKSRGVK